MVLMGKRPGSPVQKTGSFDEIKHRHTLNEVGDVPEGRYDWWTDRGRGGISL